MPPLERLTDINLDDLFDAAGLMRLRHGILQRLLRPSARRFAQVALSFDRRVATLGLARGSAWLVHRMAGGLQTAGVDAVPVDGPTVILANHPGMVDTVALLASLACRPDLLVIARDRPFLRSLPNVARHLILVPDDDLGRVGAVRACVRHLKRGGAVLTFPAGEIEPDPATAGRLGALDSVLRWSDSLVLFARRVPSTRFVPAIVSNVVSPEANRHVLTLLRRSDADRARLAAALQVSLPRYRRRVACVAFGTAHGAFEGGGGRAASLDRRRGLSADRGRCPPERDRRDARVHRPGADRIIDHRLRAGGPPTPESARYRARDAPAPIGPGRPDSGSRRGVSLDGRQSG